MSRIKIVVCRADFTPTLSITQSGIFLVESIEFYLESLEIRRRNKRETGVSASGAKRETGIEVGSLGERTLRTKEKEGCLPGGSRLEVEQRERGSPVRVNEG
jgi:hypothetical protein